VIVVQVLFFEMCFFFISTVSALVANEGYITQPNKFIQCHGCRWELCKISLYLLVMWINVRA